MRAPWIFAALAVAGCHPGAARSGTSSSDADASGTSGTSEEPPGAPLHAAGLALGREHACARTAEGAVICWGANDVGQLGDGTTAARAAPVRVRGLDEVVDLVAGDRHTCARRRDATVWCWGANARAQLGDGTTLDRQAPVKVAEIFSVASIAAGGDRTCARKDDGFVRCWGEEVEGGAVKTPTPVFDLNETSEVAVAATHACARVPSEGVRCWGANNLRQLGVSRTESRGLPVAVPGLEDAVALALGRESSCARTQSGAMLCWGGGLACVPGPPAPGRKIAVRPAGTPGLEKTRAIAAGGDQACAATDEGAVLCLRTRSDGDRACVAAPIAGAANAVDVALGDGFGCARDASSAVVCWGKNDHGQLGDGTRRDAARAVPARAP